jgi:hypothetical protein
MNTILPVVTSSKGELMTSARVNGIEGESQYLMNFGIQAQTVVFD